MSDSVFIASAFNGRTADRNRISSKTYVVSAMNRIARGNSEYSLATTSDTSAAPPSTCTWKVGYSCASWRTSATMPRDWSDSGGYLLTTLSTAVWFLVVASATARAYRSGMRLGSA